MPWDLAKYRWRYGLWTILLQVMDYLNQYLLIIKWTHGNKIHWYSNENTTILIQQNAFKDIVCKMTAILSRPLCVNQLSCHIPPVRYLSTSRGYELSMFKSRTLISMPVGRVLLKTPLRLSLFLLISFIHATLLLADIRVATSLTGVAAANIP